MSIHKKVKVRVHNAYFINAPQKELCSFINIKNTFKRRVIVINHIWFFSNERTVGRNGAIPSVIKEVQNGYRPLPFALKAGEEWETWITVGDFPINPNTVVVTLDNGKTLISKKRKGVSASGIVP